MPDTRFEEVRELRAAQPEAVAARGRSCTRPRQ